MPSSPRFTPLLEGSDRKAAEAALERIAQILKPQLPTLWRPDVAGGHAGLALWFFEAGRYFQDPALEKLAFECMARAATAPSDDTPGMDFCLFHGKAGVVWVVDLLARKLGDAAASQRLGGSVETSVVHILRTADPWPFTYDLMAGLAGAMLFLCHRPPSDQRGEGLTRAIRHLDQMACVAPQGRYLFKSRRYEPDGGYSPTWMPVGWASLGSAHGVAGALAALTAALETVEPDSDERNVASKLRDDFASWLLSQVPAEGTQPGPGGYLLPMHQGPQAFYEGRAGWCMGELGVAAVLASVAPSMSSPLREQLVALARRVALNARDTWPGDTSLADPWLCHGLAGVAYLFGHLAVSLGEASLAGAASAALRRLLDANDELGWEAHARTTPTASGVLQGQAGVALALLAALAPSELGWDGMLGLRSRRS